MTVLCVLQIIMIDS